MIPCFWWPIVESAHWQASLFLSFEHFFNAIYCQLGKGVPRQHRPSKKERLAKPTPRRRH